MTGEGTPQNIYDDQSFFSGYAQMERFGAGWDQALEQPSFLALLPDVRSQRVLDLGCGAGQLALYLAEQGAAEVIGVDISAKMLGLAQTERTHPRITYQRQAIEDVAFSSERFELVVSSLAFHYVRDYAGLIGRIAHWLVPGGALIFSVEHPIYTARLPGNGWVLDNQGYGNDSCILGPFDRSRLARRCQRSRFLRNRQVWGGRPFNEMTQTSMPTGRKSAQTSTTNGPKPWSPPSAR